MASEEAVHTPNLAATVQDSEGYFRIKFQDGPVKEVGVNGCQTEDILKVLIARLKGFQEGEFACAENAEAVGALISARYHLVSRTVKRITQNVEGIDKPHKS